MTCLIGRVLAAVLVSIISCLPLLVICTPPDSQGSSSSSSFGNSSSPESSLQGLSGPFVADAGSLLRASTSVRRPVYVMFTIDWSKGLPDPVTEDLIPETSVSIKLGASNRKSTLPAATLIELRRYTIVSDNPSDESFPELIGRQPPLGDQRRFSIYTAEFSETSQPLTSFFEQTLGQEQHIDQYVSTVGFLFGSTSITNVEIVSPNDGNGIFAEVIARNPRVRSSNTVASIMQRLLNNLDAMRSPNQEDSMTQIASYLQRIALYQRIEHRFPAVPIPVIITKSGTSRSFHLSCQFGLWILICNNPVCNPDQYQAAREATSTPTTAL